VYKQGIATYCSNILEYFSRGYTLYFIDETQANTWARSSRVWQRADAPLKQVLSQPRLMSTIVGSLNTRGELVCSHADSTSGAAFHDFLDVLLPTIQDPHHAILIMDNHAAHKMVAIRERVSEKGIWIEFLPVCASFLNPIETLWAVFKRGLAQTVLEHRNNHWYKALLVENVTRVITDIPFDQRRNIALGFQRVYEEYLEKYSNTI
jgi:transposase